MRNDRRQKACGSPAVWRGAAFDRGQAVGMIARKTMELSNVVQQAAPGNVSARELPKRCRIVRTKVTRNLCGDIRGRSREPPASTRSVLANAAFKRRCAQLRTGVSSSLQALGRHSPYFISLCLLQDLGDKAGRASLFRLQEETTGIKLWG